MRIVRLQEGMAIDELRQMYERIFPADERMPFAKLVRPADSRYETLLLMDGDRLGGFVTLFDCDAGLSYLSYFALAEDLRGQGRGTAVMRELLTARKRCRFVLDIEEVPSVPAVSVQSRRRDFYRRCGFDHTGIGYMYNDVRYELLSANGLVTREDFHELITLYWGEQPAARTVFFETARPE